MAMQPARYNTRNSVPVVEIAQIGTHWSLFVLYWGNVNLLIAEGEDHHDNSRYWERTEWLD